MIRACYVTVFEQSQEELEKYLYDLFDDLGAVYDKYESTPLNPSNNQYELTAYITQNFEFQLTVHWHSSERSYILVTFDVEMAVPVEPFQLEKALVIPAENYFQKATLVYNSYGDERSKRLFPLVMNIENALREFIISIMLKKYGYSWEFTIDKYIEDAESNSEIYQINDDWKDKVKYFKSLKEEAVKSQKNDYPKYNPLFMHWLYYVNLKDLVDTIEIVDFLEKCKVDELQGRNKPVLVSQLTFASVVGKEERDTITNKIRKLNLLRNKLMHGRYLTAENEELIKSICEELKNLIVQSGHINNFCQFHGK
ncbi:MAG: hypothetical protein ACK57R_18245 [Dolichospermum sp.]|jgi:hypothetical protein|nr:hypothetical protein [Anabaena sp. 49628_E55]